MTNVNDTELLEHLRTIPGLDVTVGLANLSGNIEQYHRLLVQLDGMFWDDISHLAEILNQRQVKQVRGLIHSLKGAAGTLGLTALHNRAVTLETHLRSRGDLIDQEAVELTRALSIEMDRFHQFLPDPDAGK